MAKVIPAGATWVKQAVTEFNPTGHSVTVRDGSKLSYDFLVVAAGLQLQFDRIKGFPEALSADGVSSNYHSQSVERTWANIKAVAAKAKAGEKAVWLGTQPPAPIKCAGAPQKIAYMADWWFRNEGVRDNVQVDFLTAAPAIFGVPKYAEALSRHASAKNIAVSLNTNLVELRTASKEAVFTSPSGEIVRKYDAIHVTPPQGPHPFYAKSPLAAESGFVSVSKETTQHTRFPNVFALGDCSSIPTSKTAAAVAAQCAVTKLNVRAAILGQSQLPASYDGYTSCPLVLGRDSAIIAEFSGFDNRIMETFPIDQSIPSPLLYFVKANLLPTIYWDGLLTGRWEGPGFFRRAWSSLSPFQK
jgi:NADPH-dependent 2,4-dienoyl-CoA reductase/sulfur reductase-like enzyme